MFCSFSASSICSYFSLLIPNSPLISLFPYIHSCVHFLLLIFCDFLSDLPGTHGPSIRFRRVHGSWWWSFHSTVRETGFKKMNCPKPGNWTVIQTKSDCMTVSLCLFYILWTLWIKSMSLTWELVRNAASLATPQASCIRSCILIRSLGVSYAL